MLVPIAVYDGVRWTTPWSVGTSAWPEGNPPLTVPTVPRAWWGNRSAATEWELLDGAGARRRIRATGVTTFENHCTGDIGLSTDFSRRVDLEPHSFPLPYAGIVATEPGILQPVTVLSREDADFRVIARQLPRIFGRLEPGVWGGVTGLDPLSLKEPAAKPRLVAVYSAPLPDGRSLLASGQSTFRGDLRAWHRRN